MIIKVTVIFICLLCFLPGIFSVSTRWLCPDTIICSSSFHQPPPSSSSSSLLLNLWPIYTLENQKSPLKLRRPLQIHCEHESNNTSSIWSPASSPFLRDLQIRKTETSATGNLWNATVSSLRWQSAPDIPLWRGQVAAAAHRGILDAACAWLCRFRGFCPV